MQFRRALALLPFLLAGCVSETTVQHRLCADASAPYKAIVACTKLIESGAVTGRELGVAHLNRASGYSHTGSMDKALVDLNAAVRLVPNDAMFIGSRGVVKGMKGDLDAAIADFSAAIKLDDSGADWYTNRGKALSDKNQFASAIPDFDTALEIEPRNAFALNGRCWARAALNSGLDLALADCNASVEVGGVDIANTLNSRGLVYFRRGDYREAIANYDKSLKVNPKLASSYYVRGLARRALGEEGAQADIDKGLSLEPGVRDRYASYGVNP